MFRKIFSLRFMVTIIVGFALIWWIPTLFLAPNLFFNYKILIIATAHFIILLQLPVIPDMNDIKESKSTDRGSTIIFESLIIFSTLIAVVEFVYFHKTTSSISIFSITGIVLIIIALVLRGFSCFYLRNFYSNEICILSKHELITKGPFAIVRHPLALSWIIYYLGVFLMLEAKYGFIVYLLWFVYLPFRLKHEETVLLKHFGENYIKYKQKTPFSCIPYVF